MFDYYEAARQTQAGAVTTRFILQTPFETLNLATSFIELCIINNFTNFWAHARGESEWHWGLFRHDATSGQKKKKKFKAWSSPIPKTENRPFMPGHKNRLFDQPIKVLAYASARMLIRAPSWKQIANNSQYWSNSRIWLRRSLKEVLTQIWQLLYTKAASEEVY